MAGMSTSQTYYVYLEVIMIVPQAGKRVRTPQYIRSVGIKAATAATAALAQSGNSGCRQMRSIPGESTTASVALGSPLQTPGF